MDKIATVGFDVDKSTLKACLKTRDGQKSVIKSTRIFGNSQSGFNEIGQWIKKHLAKDVDGIHCVMEATGVYHEHLAWFLYNHKYAVHIVLPLRAKRYMQSLGIKSKNDKIDARGLADMGLQQELEIWKPCSKNLLLLRSVTRQLEMLQETRTVFRNQLEACSHSALCDKLVIKNLDTLITTVEKEIKKLKARVAQLIEEDELLNQKYKLVEPLKGFGLTSFATIVAETGGFELFENQKQLVSYAGYDVVENQSGTRIGKTKISKKGNTHIRRILHMPAFNMVRYHVAPMENVYQRVYDRSKVKMKGYVAVQRKLLCLVYALWKNGTPYDPAHKGKTYSGIHEPKPLFSVRQAGPEKKVANEQALATLDGLPCIQSPEALFSVT
jgi:transposase